ncbi:MAG: type 2 lantipeptide synthetase LanM, partial [Actinobacteria bacterium]|nr:type 2 lantipeptide synthetase LanM [Actinomycetota bacterium]
MADLESLPRTPPPHVEPEHRPIARDAVRARVREYVQNRSSCPDELITDSCLRPQLAVALEGLSDATAACPVGLGPELKRAFLHALGCSVEYAAKVAHALAQDWPELRARFGWSDDPQDIAVAVLPSDHHGGGETVVRLDDRAGHGRALYKPRPLQLEELLTRRLRELAETSAGLRDWTLPGYLLRSGHGWVEFVDSTACRTQVEVARYYHRAGVLLALATALGITDLHCENLICHADSPVPIDLETALHHRQRPGAPSRSGMVLPRVMEWNALATGLLPTWIWKGGDRRGVDLSGLGAIGEQWCSLPLQQFVARDTPVEQLVRDGVQLLPSGNTVRLNDRYVAPWEHLDELLAGFEDGVGLLVGAADTLAELISAACGLEARFLARPTAGYHYAIQASLHPSYLHDPQRRRSFLTSALTDTTRVEPWLVQAEAQACYWADIPRFVTGSASPDIRERYYGGHGVLSDEEHILG